MTYNDNIKAILECTFAGFKEEIIDIACNRILELEQGPKYPCDVCKYNPPSSGDGKPCTMCPAESGAKRWREYRNDIISKRFGIPLEKYEPNKDSESEET